MIRKEIRTTNKPTINEIMNEELEKEPELDPPKHITDREHYIGVTAIAFEKSKGIIATDLPGRFPTTSGLDKSMYTRLTTQPTQCRLGLDGCGLFLTIRDRLVTRKILQTY